MNCNTTHYRANSSSVPGDPTGRQPHEIIGTSPDDCLPHEDAAHVKDQIAQVLESRAPIYSEQSLQLADGDSWQSAWLVPVLDADGKVARVMGIARDITKRHHLEKELERRNSLLNAMVENSPDGVLVVDERSKILSCNRRFADMWRVPHELIAQGHDDAVLKAVVAQVKDSAAFLERVRFYYDHPLEVGHDEIEFADGRVYDRHTVSLFGTDRVYLGRIWFFRDITARQAAERTAAALARTDGLTGLANRRAFVERLSLSLAEARRGGRAFAVLYFDLDHFKDVNDTLGHPIGDLLLKQIADRLGTALRETDLVARFGGDEFAVLQADTEDPISAARTATKIGRLIEEVRQIEGNEIHITASVGIASYAPDVADAESMMRRADLALYRAKDEGRRCFRFHDRGLEEIVRERVTLADDLHRALERDELELYFQPEVDISCNRIVGLEALVRWNHPTRGLLEPGAFIPVAERTGIVVALGRWAFDQACRHHRRWRDQGIVPPTIAVNVSALQFRAQGELERDIAASLEKWGVAAGDMALELTETVLMEVSQKSHQTLESLRAIGVQLAIDDFGTGYSSLNYLTLYPVNYLKIAQELVLRVTSDHRSATVVRTAIGLALELGIQAIAEGVEDEAHVRFLRSAGCRLAQGHYFNRPMKAACVDEWLREGMECALRSV